MVSTGLFIGAGFSKEYGMPLAQEVTDELLDWLTLEKLNELARKGVISSDTDLSEDVLEEYAAQLRIPGQNYEDILKWIQDRYLEETKEKADKFLTLYRWTVDVIEYIFNLRHTNNVTPLKASVSFYRGLRFLADNHRPLWIFSLNHDLCVEILAGELDIPLSTGFHSRGVKLPRRNEKGDVLGHLHFDTLSKDEFFLKAMDFFNEGFRGINSLKVHGSLDFFGYLDKTQYLKLSPNKNDTDSWIESLKYINEQLFYPGLTVRPTREIAIADSTGEMQFLRRTMVAGGYKFDSRFEQVAPPELLDVLKEVLNKIQALIVIGYGFQDNHINDILKEWLSGREERTILIVDPKIKAIPDCFNECSTRVNLKKMTATDWLDSISGNQLTVKEQAIKKLRFDPKGQALLKAVMDILKPKA